MRTLSLSRVFSVVLACCLSVTLAACPQCGRADDDDSDEDSDDDDGNEGEGEGEGEGEPFDGDVLEFLGGLDGVVVNEVGSQNDGYRAFELTITQPVDHGDPDGPSFPQRAVLIHRDATAPMILTTSGYMLYEEYEQLAEEITVMLQANQVNVEERFFGSSTPGGDDWSQLTIEQAASDHHRIVEMLKPLYRAAWVSTGHSKGGMTSLYHERFFPGDVDAVVAYVTPISFGAPDVGYRSWLADIGDPACRDDIRSMQRQAAEQLSGIVDILEDEGSGASRASLENYAKNMISTYEWGFWQFYAVCDGSFDGLSINSPEDAIGAFGITTFGVAEAYRDFAAYTYQSRFQLGFPDQTSPHLDDLFGTIDPYALDDVIGRGPWAVEPTYDAGAAMQDIASFTAAQGERLLFIYGSFDPWTGGALDPGDAVDSFKLVAPAANHGAYIASLTANDQAIALDALQRWTNVTPGPGFAASTSLPLVSGAHMDALRTRDRAYARHAMRAF